MVTITYGHGKLYDFESVTGWTERGTTGDGSFATDGDKVTLTKTGAGDYYIDNDTDIDISTSLYPIILWRYKTSDTNIKAKIVAEFSDASTQTILAEVSSTTETMGYTTLTEAKTLDHIRLHADDATGTVKYDFVLVCKNLWTFPTQQPESMTFNPCPPNYADLIVPSRSGDITQGFATHLAEVDMTCNLDVGDWKRATDYINGEVFIDIAHNSKTEPWQWLDTETEQFKVTLRELTFNRIGGAHKVNLKWKEYRLGSAADESYVERYGLNL
jgi:hypothetical protein